jgi:hypothetical protein
MRWLVVLVLLALVPRVARAQGPDDKPRVAKKYNWEAQLITVAAVGGSMVAGIAIAGDEDEGTRVTIGASILFGGLVLGPCAGHWYIGDEYVTTGLKLRLASFLAIPAVAIFDPYLNRPSVSAPIITGSVLLFLTGMVWDHATLPSAVRRYNREHVLVPAVTSNGIAIAGTF